MSKHLLIFCFLVTALTGPGFNAYAQGPVTVIEQFPAMYCPDSQEADQIFSKLSQETQDPDIIMMACHVPYFDTDEKTSPLTHEGCEARALIYKVAMVSGFQTPETIIDGRYQTYGKHENVLRAGIKMSQAISRIQPVSMELKDGQLNVRLPDLQGSGPLELWLFTTSASRSNIINDQIDESGVPMTYWNVVEHAQRLSEWDGAAKDLSLDIEDLGGDRIVFIIQKTQFAENGPDILAAGQIKTRTD